MQGAQPNPTAAGGRAQRGAIPSSRPLWGVGLLMMSMWVLPCLDASGKWLVTNGVPLLFLTWMRYATHLLLMLVVLVPRRGIGVLASRRPFNQVVRGLGMVGASLMFFASLRSLPQAEATAICYLSPLLVLLVAPWILKESPRLSSWLAAGLAFVGVLIIIRPGGGLNPFGVTLGLLSALCFTTQYVFTRRVAIDDPYTSIIWGGLVGTVLLTPVLPFILPSAWPTLRELSPGAWMLLCSTGVTGSIGHLLQIAAYRNAPASALAPFSYFSVISATVVGWIVTGHFPDVVTWIGLLVIFTCGAGVGVYEWRRAKSSQGAQ